MSNHAEIVAAVRAIALELRAGLPGAMHEVAFKRELFLRLYSRERVDLEDAPFYWRVVQRAWAAKPEDC